MAQSATIEIQGEMRRIKMGVGDAIRRLVEVEKRYTMGVFVSEDLVRERELIVAALNQFELDLGFDCDGDGEVDIASDVEIFEQSAQTSCCRILPRDYSRRPTRTGKSAGKPRRVRVQRSDSAADAPGAKGATQTPASKDAAPEGKQGGFLDSLFGSKKK